MIQAALRPKQDVTIRILSKRSDIKVSEALFVRIALEPRELGMRILSRQAKEHCNQTGDRLEAI